MTITVVDLETTGLSGGIVEIACVAMPSGMFKHTMVKPSVPIEIQAMAVHHITEDMVKDLTTIEEIVQEYNLLDCELFAAHNAEFDRSFLPEAIQKKQWICTWRCALHLWPDAPTHSNQGLRYYLKLQVGDMPAEAGITPHRALYDAWVTAKLLELMLESKSVEELLKLTVTPVLLSRVTFGKHKGANWDRVPKDYLRWILKQDNMDKDTVHTARYYLGA